MPLAKAQQRNVSFTLHELDTERPDEQRILIEVRIHKPKDPIPPPAIDMSPHRVAMTQELKQIVEPLAIERRRKTVSILYHKNSVHMMNDTLLFGREHKWDIHMTAQALGITRTSLANRLWRYTRKGWIRKNGKGWVKADGFPKENKIGSTQF